MRINADRHRKPVQIERKTKRRRHLSTGQSFDQKSVFNSVEASKGNIFAKVVETNPLRVTAMTFLNCAKTHQVFDVILRNVETANKATFTNFPANPKSHFQRTIDDAGGTYEARLNVGDIVELQSVMTNYAEDTLLPWNYKLIRACDENPLSKLLLPETPCSFIPHQRYNAETESKETTYSLAIAMKGEAVKVDSIVDNFPLLRSFIGLDDTMKKGFLIRGRKSKNSKEYHGFSCYVTDADIEEGLTQNQILMNFFKSTSHHFINSVSGDNQWEIIPLYIVTIPSIVHPHAERLASRFKEVVAKNSKLYEMCFAHFNVALSFSDGGRTLVSHINIARAKPINLPSALPDRARETNIQSEEVFSL